MSTHWADGASAASAVFGAVTAAIALRIAALGNRATERSNEIAQAANRAADAANRTAEAVARIEQQRWHIELTPQFDITLTGDSGDRAKLHIYLSGPDHLGQLDEVLVRVEDDDMLHEARPGDPDVTQDDYDNFVWGPFRFPFGADGADRAGQTIAPFSLSVGKGRPLAMERTRPGHWMRGRSQEQWQSQYRGHPVRLVLTCRRGDEEWILARPVDQPPAPPEFHSWA